MLLAVLQSGCQATYGGAVQGYVQVTAKKVDTLADFGVAFEQARIICGERVREITVYILVLYQNRLRIERVELLNELGRN